MSALDENFLVTWTGLKSAIGSGSLADWEEYTDGRDRYLEGHAAPGSTGGSTAVHGHTGINRTHQGIPHSHTITTGGPTTSYGNEHNVTALMVAGGLHSHSDECPEATITYYPSAPVLNDCSAGATQPSTCTVFWIKLKTSKTGDVPDAACCFTDATSAPTGYALCDGAGGRPDMVDRYLLGCSASDTVGDVQEGSDTHGHTAPAHVHSCDPHNHPDGTIANGTPYAFKGSGLLHNIPATWDHTHPVTNFSTESGLGNTLTAIVTGNAASNDPQYYTLLAVINDSGGELTPTGAIVAYTAAGALPSGWQECDGVDYAVDLVGAWIKGTATGGSVGDSGDGDIDDHTHVDPGHGHTHPGGSHNHTFSFGASSTATASSSGRATMARYIHTHSFPNCGLTEPTLEDGTATWATADGKWPYRTVRWVRYAGVTYKRAHAGTMAKTPKEVLAA